MASSGNRGENSIELRALIGNERRVMIHLNAHSSTVGEFVMRQKLVYFKGPNSKLFVAAGKVGFDIKPVKNNPQATLSKASRIKAAALACIC